MSTRRTFIAGLGAATAWPLAARAQQKLPVIGWLGNGAAEPSASAVSAFRDGLSSAGFVEGRNVAIEYRWADGQNDRLPSLAAQLVQRRIDVIVTAPTPQTAAAAKAATTVIPIIFMCSPDPVRAGLVASLNRPSGNLTGVTILGGDLTAKRIGLLHDIAPQVTTIAMLLDGRAARDQQEFQLKEAESAARNARVRVVGVWASDEADFDPAFARVIGEKAGVVLVSAGFFFGDHKGELAALAIKYRLPAIYQSREYTAAGGLMSYGPSLNDAYRQVGIYTGRVLEGEKPADLPVLQPTKFELVINLKAAKSLGLDIPAGVLAAADEVIE